MTSLLLTYKRYRVRQVSVYLRFSRLDFPSSTKFYYFKFPALFHSELKSLNKYINFISPPFDDNVHNVNGLAHNEEKFRL